MAVFSGLNFTNNGSIGNTLNSTLSFKTSMINTAVCGLFMVLMCGGNGLFILAYNKCKELQTMANFLLVNLAVADFTVGLSMPFYMIFFWLPSFEQNSFMCALRYSVLIFPLLASTEFLMVIGIDRYLAVSRPLTRTGFATKKNLLTASTFVWATSFVGGGVGPLVSRVERIPVCEMLTVLKWEYMGAFLVPVFTAITVAMTCFYVAVIIKVARQTATIDKVLGPAVSSQQLARRYQQEKAVAITVLLVVGVFYICWGPLFTVFGVQVYGNRIHDQMLNKVRITVARFLGVGSSAVNVIIYVWRMPRFRGAIKQFFCKPRETTLTTNSFNFTETSEVVQVETSLGG